MTEQRRPNGLWASIIESTKEMKTNKVNRKLISLRIPEALFYKIKVLANSMDVSYQTLIKIYLFDAVKRY